MKKIYFIIFLFVFGFFLVYKGNAIQLFVQTREYIQKTKCESEKKAWFSCLNAYGPCGCKVVYADGGKNCQSGNNCSSGVCRISKGTKQNINGLFIGECPKYSDDTGCGFATIDNGKIVEDNRSCIY